MSKRFRILVVDDDDALRSIFVQLISATHNTFGVENGEKAVEIAQRESFDLAFVDMLMPGMDGLDTMRALKKNNPEMIVAIITGYGYSERIEQALKEGALAHLQKPIPFEVIRNIIDEQEKTRGQKSG